MLASTLFGPVLPEIVLSVGTLALLLYGVFGGDRTVTLVNGLAVVLLAVVGLMVVSGDGRIDAFSGVFVVDGFARFLKLLVVVGSAATIVIGNDYLRREGVERFEFALVILLATIGMLLMVSANDLISLYMGLELQSLAAYVVAALHRDDLKSTEAGLKYFVLGALSSGMLLYGASLIYGFSGHTTFVGIAAAVQGRASLGLVFGLVFLMAGLAFKISAVPFHMWTPDVYEGAPTPVTTFFAGAPKMAAMGLTVRVVMTAFPGIVHEWQQIIVFIALASMALGAFAAIGQTNIKRLMAYSSISHMGYALVGLAAGTEEGVRGVLIYLAVYLAMTVGVFTVILSMRRAGRYVETIGDLAGLSRTQPAMALALAVLMWSLAGLPPFAGFFAKLYTFLAAVHVGLYALAALGFVASVVGCYYYLRIVKLMYFDEPAARFEAMPVPHRVVLALSACLTAFFIVWPGLITGPAALAAKSLF